MTRNLKKKYEELIDDLSRDTDDRYKEYLRSKPETLEVDNIIFDIEELDSYYRCDGCKRRKRKAFCCHDHDLELTQQDIDAIEKVLDKVTKKYPRLDRALGDEGFWVWGENFEKLMRRKDSEDCVFLMPGAEGCYLHGWALDHGLDPVSVKPYVCSLYPLVVIIIEDDIVVTTVNDDSEKILDCGEEAHPCTTRRGKEEEHTVIRCRPIMEKMFGAEMYKKLHDRIFNGRRPQGR